MSLTQGQLSSATAGAMPPRILLDEDDPHVAETRGELLQLEGFHVIVAHEAEAGVVRARAEPPHIVFSDPLSLVRCTGMALLGPAVPIQAYRGCP